MSTRMYVSHQFVPVHVSCSGQDSVARITFSRTSHALKRINMQTFRGRLQEDSSSRACRCRFFYEELKWNESGGDFMSQQEPSPGEIGQICVVQRSEWLLLLCHMCS